MNTWRRYPPACIGCAGRQSEKWIARSSVVLWNGRMRPCSWARQLRPCQVALLADDLGEQQCREQPPSAPPARPSAPSGSEGAIDLDQPFARHVERHQGHAGERQHEVIGCARGEANGGKRNQRRKQAQKAAREPLAEQAHVLPMPAGGGIRLCSELFEDRQLFDFASARQERQQLDRPYICCVTSPRRQARTATGLSRGSCRRGRAAADGWAVEKVCEVKPSSFSRSAAG